MVSLQRQRFLLISVESVTFKSRKWYCFQHTLATTCTLCYLCKLTGSGKLLNYSHFDKISMACEMCHNKIQIVLTVKGQKRHAWPTKYFCQKEGKCMSHFTEVLLKLLHIQTYDILYVWNTSKASWIIRNSSVIEKSTVRGGFSQ